jgi:hypothetical protein
MGSGRWEPKEWGAYSSTHIHSRGTVDEIYTSKSIVNELDPKGVKIRESCDSVDNPNSTAVIVALDVTGSMSQVLDSMAREGLKTLAEEIYNRKPITDPHLMFMGIGDVEMGDRSPLQVTQFEADIRIAEQLTKLHLERGGGGNHYESYALAWYFAGLHTRVDCFEKRAKKGFLFTVGDEEPTPYLKAHDIEKVMGYRPEKDLTSKELLTMASKYYEVYHLMVEEGSNFSGRGADKIVNEWTDLLGQRAIRLSDHKKMGEVIVSILQLEAGIDKATITSSWDGSTGIVVSRALDSLSNIPKTGGVINF